MSKTSNLKLTEIVKPAYTNTILIFFNIYKIRILEKLFFGLRDLLLLG